MLEKVDLTLKLSKKEYQDIAPQLELRLGELQRQLKELAVPVILVFEGWNAVGKGNFINQLMLCFDPRGPSVCLIKPPNEEELLRPYMWRFWIKTPEKGRIIIFDRSWYKKVLEERIDKVWKKSVWMNGYNEINSFERQLVDSGTIIIKFFLHIDKKEQTKHLKKLEKNPSTAWRVTNDDWKHNQQYDLYTLAIEDMLAKTDSGYAPWTIVEAKDSRFAATKIYNTVIQAMEKKIDNVMAEQNSVTNAKRKNSIHIPQISGSVLDRVDLTKSLPKSEYKLILKKYHQRLLEIEHEIYEKRIPLVIVYEGSDAGGKGGNIRRLLQGLDPRGYEVIPIAAPNDVERKHHYLWRFWMKFPKAGHIAIFDRSWYGRVLVERVEGFCSEIEWKRAYKEINEMEQQCASFGTVIIKFWIHIDQDEQLNRFEAREKNPHKQWKITEEDWRNREKWPLYKTAVDEMLFRTSTNYAPWTIIEGNNKPFARIKTIETVIRTVEKKLK